jgi:hypothetical protein
MNITLAEPTESAVVHKHPGWAVAGVLAGATLAFAWSYEFVDQVIGMNVANSLLGHDAKQTALAGSVTGAIFAVVSGLAGTLTACNVALFGALPNVTAYTMNWRSRLAGVLRALGLLGAGLMVVAALYGALAVLLGTRLPQLSTAMTENDVPERLIQSIVVFGLIGLAFGYLGLAALGLVPDPFDRRPRLRLVVLGALIGGFIVGRPYPLFFKLLNFAVESGNPLYGALTMMLQAFGNIVAFAVLALLLTFTLGRWLADPRRAAPISGVALLLLGTFLVLYWDVRLPAMFGYGWFPTAPWNG